MIDRPFDASVVSVGGGLLLATLPVRTGLPFRLLAPAVGVLTLALALSPAQPALDAASGFACVAALLGALSSAACAGDPDFAGLAGRRLRLARAIPALMTGASLLATACADLACATAALAALALLSSLATGLARGSVAALASWRLLRLQSMAIAGCLLGLSLLHVGMAPAGAGMLLLGFLALGGAAPFASALAAAGAQADAPFASLMAGLLPLASFALLLRARLLLVGSGLASIADGTLLLSGLLSVAIGAGLVWACPAGARRDAAAGLGVSGLVVFAFGTGGAAGLQAGLVGLLAASFALPARVLAGRLSGGWLRLATMLAAACVPPFGLFAAAVLILEATLAHAPALLLPFLLLSCALLGGCLRGGAAHGPAPNRAVQTVLALHLAIAATIGLALPATVSDRIVALAERLAGAPG